MARPRFAALLRSSSLIDMLQALAGLGMIFCGLAQLSIPAALFFCGLLIWHDATRPPPKPEDKAP